MKCYWDGVSDLHPSVNALGGQILNGTKTCFTTSWISWFCSLRLLDYVGHTWWLSKTETCHATCQTLWYLAFLTSLVTPEGVPDSLFLRRMGSDLEWSMVCELHDFAKKKKIGDILRCSGPHWLVAFRDQDSFWKSDKIWIGTKTWLATWICITRWFVDDLRVFDLVGHSKWRSVSSLFSCKWSEFDPSWILVTHYLSKSGHFLKGKLLLRGQCSQVS